MLNLYLQSNAVTMQTEILSPPNEKDSNISVTQIQLNANVETLRNIEVSTFPDAVFIKANSLPAPINAASSSNPVPEGINTHATRETTPV